MVDLLTKDGGIILGFAQVIVNKQTVVNEVLYLEPDNMIDYFQYRVGNGIGEPLHKAFHCCFKFFVHLEPEGSPIREIIKRIKDARR